MISTELIQRSIILHLRSNLLLLTELGNPNKITESQYQGQDIGYPTVKVDIGTQSPEGNGTDHKKLSRIYWSVQVFSESLGSVEANRIMGITHLALFDKQIVGRDDANNVIFQMLRIDTINTQAAIRLSNRLWKAEIFLESTIYPITDDPYIPT